jgi:methylisocitrate lyase
MAMSAGSRLRALLKAGGLVAAPGAIDALTARIIQAQGFPAIYLGGNAIGLHLGVGQPFVTLTETVDCAHQVANAVDIPLIVDAGAGFGDAAHVHRATRELERAGVAAIHIDDQPYPKRAHYHLGKGDLAPVSETLAKLAAARAARRDADLLIFARTDALRVTRSIDETIERCRAYAAAGADALMVLDLSAEDLVKIRARMPDVPLAWFVSPSMSTANLKTLEDAGFKLALFPFNTVAAIVESVTATWAAVRADGAVPQTAERLTSLRDSVQKLIGMDTYWDIEERTAGMTRPNSGEKK